MRLGNICFMLFLCLSSFAQSLTGSVLDTSQTPIENVSVILSDSDGRPVSFCHTDVNGKFLLDTSKASPTDYVSFSCIGYSKLDKAINELKSGQVIILQNDEFVLKEVKVKANKIIQSGDTLTYSVSAFRQKQDRTISDVLAKMPGITVMPSGEIKYQGKAINKFYIEGIDLLGGKYSVASENIKADQVKNVQIYQDHQPVKVLKDVQFSDQAALNLVLSEDAKNVWQGYIDAGVGTNLEGESSILRDSKVMEMLFSKKKQSISMFKTNNTGKNIEHELIDYTAARTYLSSSTPLIDDVALNTPTIDAEKYIFNNSNLIASNWLFKTGKDSDLRFQLNGLIDKTDVSGQISRILIDSGLEGDIITEEQNITKKRNEWSGELTYKINKEQFYLSNIAKGYIDFNHSDGINKYNQQLYSQNAKIQKRYFTDNFELIKTFSEHKSFSLKTRFIIDQLPTSLLLIDGHTEELRQNKMEWEATTGFRHKLFGMYITYDAGVSSKAQDLELSSLGSGNTYKYNETRVFLTPSLSYNTPVLKINAAVRCNIIYRNADGQKNVRPSIGPRLFVNYKLTGKWNTSFLYSHMFSPNSFNEYIKGPVFSNYYTIFHGNNKLKHTTLDMVSSLWKYHDTIHGLFANVNLSYSFLNKITMFESTYSNLFYYKKATDQTTYNSSASISGEIGKSIGWGKLSLSLQSSFTSNKYQLLINKEISDCNSNNYSGGFEISYHPWDFFSLEYNTTLNINNRQYKNKDRYNSNFKYFHHKLKLISFIGKFQIEFINDYFRSNDKSISSILFSDLSVSYRKKSWEAMVLFNNIVGVSNIEQTYSTNNQIVFSSTKLRPREIMLKLSFAL